MTGGAVGSGLYVSAPATAAPSGGAVHDLVLDPAGVAGGNVYTSWATVIAAAFALDGMKRILVVGDVAVGDLGALGSGLAQCQFYGAQGTGALGLPTITFAGNATHADWPQLIDAVNIDASAATATPFVCNSVQIASARLSTLAGGANALYGVAVGGGVLFLTDGCATVDLVVMAQAAGTQAAIEAAGTGVGMNSDVLGAVAGAAAVLSQTTPTSAINSIGGFPNIDPAAVFQRRSPGKAAIYSTNTGGDITTLLPNGFIRLDDSGPTLTLDLDAGTMTSEEYSGGNFMDVQAGALGGTVETLFGSFLSGGTTFALGAGERWHFEWQTVNNEWAAVQLT